MLAPSSLSLGTYVSFQQGDDSTPIIGDLVGDDDPAVTWDTPGIITSISGKGGGGVQYLVNLQAQYTTHSGESGPCGCREPLTRVHCRQRRRAAQ